MAESDPYVPPFETSLGPLRRAVSPGLIDAGLASAATLITGIVAAGILEGDGLGVYALFFAGFVLAAAVPAQLVLAPVENQLIGRAAQAQINSMMANVPRGVSVATLAGGAIIGVVLLLTGIDDPALTLPLAATAFALMVLSPLQDHARRMLHQLDRSVDAAKLSALQLASVAGFLGAASLLSVPDPWIPLGALAAANAVTLAAAARLFSFDSSVSTLELQLRAVLRIGRWFLAANLSLAAFAFAAYAIMDRLATPTDVGHAEAARLVAQPLGVLMIGIVAVLRPRLFESVRATNLSSLQRLHTYYVGAILGAALLMVTVFAFEWRLNPMRYVVPRAYEVAWLALITVFATALSAAGASLQIELQARGRERDIAVSTSVGAVVGLATVAAISRAAGAFAAPVGWLAFAVASTTGFILYMQHARHQNVSDSRIVR